MSYIDEWKAAGGNVHGPNVETVTMPLDRYLRFRTTLPAQTGEAVAGIPVDAAGYANPAHPPAADFLAVVEALRKVERRSAAHPDDTDADRKRNLYHVHATAQAALASVAGNGNTPPAVVAPAEDGFDGWYATHKPGPAADSPYHWRVSHSTRKSEDRAVWNAAIAHAQHRAAVDEAIEAAALEIESGHAWITAVGASAILRKHAAAIREYIALQEPK